MSWLFFFAIVMNWSFSSDLKVLQFLLRFLLFFEIKLYERTRFIYIVASKFLFRIFYWEGWVFLIFKLLVMAGRFVIESGNFWELGHFIEHGTEFMIEKLYVSPRMHFFLLLDSFFLSLFPSFDSEIIFFRIRVIIWDLE